MFTKMLEAKEKIAGAGRRGASSTLPWSYDGAVAQGNSARVPQSQ